tara:strand:- start:410 stop:781 length:372 start_codon:yes stop_codon:yes gene_type:complete
MTLQKILIVEDDMIIQMFLSRIIKQAGFDVIGEARSCDQLLELLTTETPDLILMDIGIVGYKDGVETTAIVNEKYNIPVIFMTGNSDEVTLERARKENPLAILFKPIDEGRLKRELIKLKGND